MIGEIIVVCNDNSEVVVETGLYSQEMQIKAYHYKKCNKDAFVRVRSIR